MPRPLDVYALLPQTNCCQCSEATCMAFGFALLKARRRVDECVPLLEDEAAVPRATLLELFGDYKVAGSVWRERVGRWRRRIEWMSRRQNDVGSFSALAFTAGRAY